MLFVVLGSLLPFSVLPLHAHCWKIAKAWVWGKVSVYLYVILKHLFLYCMGSMVIVLTEILFRRTSWGSVGVSKGFDVPGEVSDHSPNDSGLAVTVDFLLTDGKSWPLMWAG